MDSLTVTREQFRLSKKDELEFLAQALGNVSGTYTTESVDPSAVVLQGTPTLAIGAEPADADNSLRIANTRWVKRNAATASGSPPTTPARGQVWIDTSADPPELKVWDDTPSPGAWKSLQARVPGALIFKGSKNPSDAAPASPAAGDVWIMSSAGTMAPTWTGIAGQGVSLHETVVWDGSQWTLLGPAVQAIVHQVTATAPLQAAGTTNVALSIDDATAAAKGVVQLADAAAVAAGTAGRVVDAALLKTSIPTASATQLGLVKVGTNLAIDATGILSAKVAGALVFQGSTAPTAAPPASPTKGDVWVMSAAGTLAAGWTGVAGTAVAIHELLVWTGAEWTLMGSAVETTVHTVTASSPLRAAGTTAVTLAVDDATSAAKGVVQLADAAAVTAGTGGRVVDAGQLKAVSDRVTTAQTAATGAQTTATAAQTAATAAQTTANTANTAATAAQTTANNCLPKAGGNMTGSVTATERTITGAMDLATGNFWTCGAIAIPNPSNAVAGMSGLIRLTAAPTSWAGNFKHAGGAAPTIAAFPAVVPFYVSGASTILCGKPVEGIA
jgi:hypothetical protein